MGMSIIRGSVVVVGAVGALVIAACSVSTTPNSITLTAQTKYTGGTVTKQSQGTWNGQLIHVFNQNGDLTIVADPNATNVSLTAIPFAYADPDAGADAQAAIADVTNLIGIDESNGFAVNCPIAQSNHGTAKNGTTGCSLTVTVPAGTTQLGLTLDGHAGNGPLTAQGTFTADTGAQVILRSDNGDVSGVQIVGGAKARSENGTVTAAFTPTVGAVEEASSGNGDVTLGLPANFAADSLQLSAPSGNVNITGFSDITATSTSRGAAGTGAKSITVTTDLGNVTIQSQ
jgi:hypothetical protein